MSTYLTSNFSTFVLVCCPIRAILWYTEELQTIQPREQDHSQDLLCSVRKFWFLDQTFTFVASFMFGFFYSYHSSDGQSDQEEVKTKRKKPRKIKVVGGDIFLSRPNPTRPSVAPAPAFGESRQTAIGGKSGKKKKTILQSFCKAVQRLWRPSKWAP